jgi:hypothetical protein
VCRPGTHAITRGRAATCQARWRRARSFVYAVNGEPPRPAGKAERLLGEAYAENAELRHRVETLQAALDQRDLIERAKGVIMGRLDLDADEAWDILHAGANGDLNGAQIAAAAVVAFRRTPAEIAASLPT